VKGKSQEDEKKTNALPLRNSTIFILLISFITTHISQHSVIHIPFRSSSSFAISEFHHSTTTQYSGNEISKTKPKTFHALMFHIHLLPLHISFHKPSSIRESSKIWSMHTLRQHNKHFHLNFNKRTTTTTRTRDSNPHRSSHTPRPIPKTTLPPSSIRYTKPRRCQSRREVRVL